MQVKFLFSGIQKTVIPWLARQHNFSTILNSLTKTWILENTSWCYLFNSEGGTDNTHIIKHGVLCVYIQKHRHLCNYESFHTLLSQCLSCLPTKYFPHFISTVIHVMCCWITPDLKLYYLLLCCEINISTEKKRITEN